MVTRNVVSCGYLDCFMSIPEKGHGTLLSVKLSMCINNSPTSKLTILEPSSHSQGSTPVSTWITSTIRLRFINSIDGRDFQTRGKYQEMFVNAAVVVGMVYYNLSLLYK